MVPTKDEFLYWLQLQPFNAYVGTARDRFACPLARYLNERYPGYTHAVFPTRVVRYLLYPADASWMNQPVTTPVRTARLPEWAQSFVQAVDQLANQLNRRITAGEAKGLIQ